jgi:hypothetical protein
MLRDLGISHTYGISEVTRLAGLVAEVTPLLERYLVYSGRVLGGLP